MTNNVIGIVINVNNVTDTVMNDITSDNVIANVINVTNVIDNVTNVTNVFNNVITTDNAIKNALLFFDNKNNALRGVIFVNVIPPKITRYNNNANAITPHVCGQFFEKWGTIKRQPVFTSLFQAPRDSFPQIPTHCFRNVRSRSNGLPRQCPLISNTTLERIS